MWPHRAVRDEPSEVNSPAVWARIREQNRVKELSRNAPQEPNVTPAPQRWLVMLGGAAIIAGFYTGNIMNGIFHILTA